MSGAETKDSDQEATLTIETLDDGTSPSMFGMLSCTSPNYSEKSDPSFSPSSKTSTEDRPLSSPEVRKYPSKETLIATPKTKNIPPSPTSRKQRSESTGRALALPSFSAPLILRRVGSDISHKRIHISSPSPIFMEARDDDLHSEADNISAYQISTFPEDQEMDEIIIQKYIAERNKFKASEKNNAILQAHISELNRRLDEIYVEQEGEKSSSEMNEAEQQKKISSLEETVKDLMEKLESQEEQTKAHFVSEIDKLREKFEEMRSKCDDEVERNIYLSEQLQNKEGELKTVNDQFINMTDEMKTLQEEYATTKVMRDHELDKNSKLMKHQMAIEEEFENMKEQFAQERHELEELQEQFTVQMKGRDEVDNMNKIQALTFRLDEMHGKYEFEKQRAADFSSELKMISYHYVEAHEKLETEQKKTEGYVKYLDKLEAELNAMTQKRATTASELEEMARGFVETDELLVKETEISSKLSATIKALNDQLQNEISRSKGLESEILSLQQSNAELMNKKAAETDDVQLQKEVSRSKGLESEIISLQEANTAIKKEAAEARTTSESLSIELADMKNRVSETDELLVKEAEISSKLSATVEAVNLQLQNEISRSKGLESEILSLQKANAASKKEVEKSKIVSESLSVELTDVKNKVSIVASSSSELIKKVLSTTKNELKTTQRNLDGINNSTETLTKENDELQMTNASLRKELNETIQLFQRNKTQLETKFIQLEEQTHLLALTRDELKATQMNLDESKIAITSLEKELNENSDTDKFINDVREELKRAEIKLEESLKLSETLNREKEKLEEANNSLRKEIDDMKVSQPDLEELKTTSKHLQEQTDLNIKYKANMLQERADFDELLVENERKIKSLSINLEGMIAKYKEQEKSVATLQEGIENKEEKVLNLTEELETTKKKYLELEQTLHVEREDFHEKIAEVEEKMTLTSKELDELEAKHSELFSNLVETEEVLVNTKKELNAVKMNMGEKKGDLNPVEIVFSGDSKRAEDDLIEEEYNELKRQNIELKKKYDELYSDLAVAEEYIHEVETSADDLKKQLGAKDQECESLQHQLEKERNGPHQRKLKVAKRMIQAEKNRFRALQKEIEAKDLIMKRMEEQLGQHNVELDKVKEELEVEKEKRVTHSRRILQDMHKQLEDQKKDMKIDKEMREEKIRSQRSQIKSLSIRLKAMENSSGDVEVSNALKQYHEVQEKVRILTAQNDELNEKLDNKEQAVEALEIKLTEVSKSLQDLTNYMDTMAQYCYGLEEEKKSLKKEIECLNQSGDKSPAQHNLFNLLEGDESESGSNDDDTVSGMSLSDFSVAVVPESSRHLNSYLDVMNRANLKSSSLESSVKSTDRENE